MIVIFILPFFFCLRIFIFIFIALNMSYLYSDDVAIANAINEVESELKMEKKENWSDVFVLFLVFALGAFTAAASYYWPHI